MKLGTSVSANLFSFFTMWDYGYIPMHLIGEGFETDELEDARKCLHRGPFRFTKQVKTVLIFD